MATYAVAFHWKQIPRVRDQQPMMLRWLLIVSLSVLGCSPQAAPNPATSNPQQATRRLLLREVCQLRVNEIPLGMTAPEVTRILGPSNKSLSGAENDWVYALGDKDSLRVSLMDSPAGRRVSSVVGNRLQLPDRTLLQTGYQRSQVEEMLGPPGLVWPQDAQGREMWFYNYENGLMMHIEVEYQGGMVKSLALSQGLRAG